MLREYLFVDRDRLASYADQIGAGIKREKVPKWKVGLALTGPSVEAQQEVEARTASSHDMIQSLVAYLKKERMLHEQRPSGGDTMSDNKPFVLERMRARKITFALDRGDPRYPRALQRLRDITVWVSNPLERPSEIAARHTPREPNGVFVYLVQGYWEGDDAIHGGVSNHTALSGILEALNESKVVALTGQSDPMTDYRSPATILEDAGGLKGDMRSIETLYRIRAWSNNQLVKTGSNILRSYDLFGYPIFVAEV